MLSPKEEGTTKKSKRTVLEIAGGILCLTLGILGGRVTMVIAHTSKQSVQIDVAGQLAIGKQAPKIAVVNLDAGVEKKDQQIYYAGKLIEYPNENYQSTSLEEAKTGVENGQYGAYVIIPSTFSTSVDSINGTPEKAIFEYQISSNLSVEEREKMIYEVSEFEKSISTNVAYMYIDAILSEVHNVQDGAATILANDDSEKQSLLSVSAQDLIEPIEFSELKENNDTIKAIDLSQESLKLQGTVRKIETDFEGWLKQGQTDYMEVAARNQEMEQSLEALQKSMESTNPLLNEKGEYNILEGINSVNAEIDAYNTTLTGKRQQLNDSIVNEINLYAGQRQMELATWKQEVQKKIHTSVVSELQAQLNTQMEIISSENKILKNQQEQDIENQITAYTAELQEYLNRSITSQEVKESIKNIVQIQAEETVKNARDSYIEYGKNYAQREDIALYNQLVADNNNKTEELQQALEKFRRAEEELAQSKGISVEELYTTPNNPEEEAYQETFHSVVEKAEAIQTAQLLEEPQVMEEPKVLVSIETEKIDMKSIQEAVDLSKAVNKENNQIKPPEINLSIPTRNISLTSDAIQYQVPEFLLSQAAPIKEETLKGIEEYYDIPKTQVSDTFEEKVVNVVRDRNDKLQKDVSEKISLFSHKQGKYQSQLDSFDPFGYVDSSQMTENVSAISDNITEIETQMNESGTEYLKYTADIFNMTNENISKLQEDMMKANEVTAKNVTDQITLLKNSRSAANAENSSILKNFSKKLSFTRVGDLPYREAYEFIINPIEYEQSDK